MKNIFTKTNRHINNGNWRSKIIIFDITFDDLLKRLKILEATNFTDNTLSKYKLRYNNKKSAKILGGNILEILAIRELI